MGRHAASSENKPLQGVVLCCTALQLERRSELGAIAEELGAIHRLDLTSDVTHLLVGSIDTPKYAFVARERPDVKVLFPAWIEAVRDTWTQGGDVDIEELEAKCRLPTFHGAQICVTGFEDLDERNKLQHYFEENGATYHGDLTREVSHLVAVAPKGKKYEFASQWHMKIVSIEWVRDSLDRGMILDEKLYHPNLPVTERGKGATKKIQVTTPPGKRKLEDAQLVRNASDGSSRARKLRRTASARCESQSDDLWADMGSIDESKKQRPAEEAEWDEDELPRKPTRAASRTHHSTPKLEPHASATLPQPAKGIFSETRLFVVGFSRRNDAILRKILPANGGLLLTLDDMQARADDDSGVIILVPHQTPRREAEQISSAKAQDVFLTEFWVEKCLFNKLAVDYTKVPLCTLFPSTHISGLESLTVCPSSFSGPDLLHFKKTVELLGAQYDERLHMNTSVLVCNNGTPNVSKLAYALDHRIPVVHAEWFWQCIKRVKVLPFERFVPRACHDYVKAHVSTRAAADTTQQDAAESQANNEEPNERIEAKTSRVLQELPPEMNSPTKAGSQVRVAESFGVTVKEDKAPTSHAGRVDDVVQNNALNSAIAGLIAQRREKASAAQRDTKRPTDRRQRKLGRGPSNPSTLNSGFSLSHSHSQMPPHSLHGDTEGGLNEPSAISEVAPPSQSLTYDDPEAAAARERLMRRMGGSEAWQDDETSKSRRQVESIGLVKDYSLAGEERRSARRVGARRQTGALDGGDDW